MRIGCLFLRRLKLVSLARLEDAFAARPAGLVLSQLFKTDEFLFEADSETADFALVSYRQEPRPPHTLRAVLLKAREAGVAALWMDAWCFRFAGEYVHEDFCALLSHVVRAVRAVIWVPLSRTNTAPSFQFRMWCTFEAAVVEHRQLPVFIAGELTASQRRLARLGPRIFALPCLEPRATLAELRILSTFNVCFLFMAIAFPLALAADLHVPLGCAGRTGARPRSPEQTS